MDINDVNPWEAMGLQEPETDPDDTNPEGEQEQEPADPAGEGEQGQEPAEPGTDDDMDDDQDPADEPEEEPAKKQPLTKEQRAENARRRRQKEVDDAVAAARADEQKKFNDRLAKFFKSARMKNAHNGNSDILSLEDAEAWAEADRLEKANAALKAGKLTAADLQTLVEESPRFKAMQQKQEQQEQAAAQESKSKFAQNVELELAEIQKLDPTVKSLADVIRMDTGKEFARLVQKHGLSYLEAFKMANMEKLMNQQARVAATAAKVASGGKDHLGKTKGVGKPPLDVPQEVKDAYRIFNPKMSDEEIEKHYRKTNKK